MGNGLSDAIIGMREDEVLQIATRMLDGGTDPMEIISLCRGAMEVIGGGFEAGEYFLPDLIMSGEILSRIAEMVKPRIGEEAATLKLGKVLIGTVAGDIHDIGKNIVVFMLDAGGFDVHDLGVDVSPQAFVDRISELEPDIVGLSCLLTIAYEAMRKTVQAIVDAGLRDKVRIMVGGGTVDEQVRGYVGADGFGADAVAAVSLAKGWMGR
ncbi:MAG: methionine synthase [Actinobacteria bacterium]|nr:MAG: methionine synthase [Actinomycetota bacterium]